MEKKRKLLGTVILVMILMVGWGITAMRNVSSSPTSSYSPANGLKLIYKVVPGDNQPSWIAQSILISRLHDISSNLSSANFFVVLHQNYFKYVDQVRLEGGVVDLNATSSESCDIASNGLNFVIAAQPQNGGSVRVDITISFIDGYAKCGLSYNPLPITNTGWVQCDAYYFSKFEFLNLTRSMVIDLTNSDCESLSGLQYGEWPFWLTKQELGDQNALLLYGINDIINVGISSPNRMFSGLASLLLLNLNQTASSPYLYGNVTISTNDQVFSDQGLIPDKKIIYNVKNSLEQAVVDLIEASTQQCSQCNEILRSLVLPIKWQFWNGNVVMNNYSLTDIASEAPHPWSLVEDAASAQSTVLVSGQPHTLVEFYRGVHYGGLTYLTIGFPGLTSISYDREGVLLHIGVAINTGRLISILPACLIRAFGIDPFFSMANSNSISLNLIGLELQG